MAMKLQEDVATLRVYVSNGSDDKQVTTQMFFV